MKNSKNIIISIITLMGLLIIIFAIFLVIKTERLTNENSVKVYFVRSIDNKDFKLIPTKRKLPRNSSEVKLLIAIQELLKGPSDKEKKAGLYTEIPSSTRILGITETDKKLIINLSKDFESGGGSTSMLLRLKQFINTALDAEKEKPVYLELEGKKVDFIGGEGIAIPQPISR